MARAGALVKPATQDLLHLRVLRTERLSPHWMRVTLGGGDIGRAGRRWLVRGDEKPGTLALDALTSLPAPTEPVHAFIVGEQSLPTAARRHLVAAGVPKESISFVGYWRTGAASPTPKSQTARADGASGGRAGPTPHAPAQP